MPPLRLTRVVFCWTAIVTGTPVHLGAQAASSRPTSPPDDNSIFASLALTPVASATRSASGAPGAKYWRNQADYDITTVVHPRTRTISGTMDFRYTNHSPDTLPVLWMTEARAGVTLSVVQVVRGAQLPVSTAVLPHDSTPLRGTKWVLAEPIKPGATATFHVEWEQSLRPTKPGRAEAYSGGGPCSVLVYDDIHGWNVPSERGNFGVFMEFGDYTLKLTVPVGYVVATTAALDNPQDVLPPAQLARWKAATMADTVVRIVTTADLARNAAQVTGADTQPGARPGPEPPMRTWKFHAKRVGSLHWDAWSDRLWDATSWHGILAQAYYRPDEADLYGVAADMAREPLRAYSERWLPYPYPQVSAVLEGREHDGIGWVMAEYMSGKNLPDLYQTLAHEIGHNWFPWITGVNEQRYMWMSEGLNMFINTFCNAYRTPASDTAFSYLNGPDQNARAGRLIGRVEKAIREHTDHTVEPASDSDVVYDGDDGYRGYYKPAAGLQLLRREILGPDVFDRGFRTFIRRWMYKHPTSADFYRTMENVSGRKLDWFWREWFFETPNFDQAINTVTQTTQGATTSVAVTYGNRARGVLPLLVRFTFSDGSTQDFRYPAEVWQRGATYAVSYTFPQKTVRRVAIDPDNRLVDTDRTNNVWTAD